MTLGMEVLLIVVPYRGSFVSLLLGGLIAITVESYQASSQTPRRAVGLGWLGTGYPGQR